MPRKHLRYKILTLLVGCVAALLAGEALLWLASPSEYMYPRYQFSPEYGILPFPNVEMVHGVPRRFEFKYTTNDYCARGETVATGPGSEPRVLVLGDSNAFGMGVNDGEEFPAVMRAALAGTVDVVSLASPGWGFTQQIRRYHELGRSFDPRIVVLQFCSNDPEDNLSNRVAMVRDGEFVFMNSTNSLNWIKKYLSRSPLQRTQLYNFARTRASRAVLGRMAEEEVARLESATPPDSTAAPATERVYIELLNAFAAMLEREGREFVIIAVDRQLDQFPHIRAAVDALAAEGRIRYVEVTDWLSGMEPYASAEGHVWGPAAHRVIGERLGREVAGAIAAPTAGSP